MTLTAPIGSTETPGSIDGVIEPGVDVTLNGRVIGRPPGGVPRYAAEVARHMRCRVLRPASARFPWSGRLWEQTTLPTRARADVVVNVAHAAPLIHDASVVVVHDLFAIDRPREVRAVYARWMSLQLPMIVRRAAAVVAVSEATAEQVADRFDLALSDVPIASPGISSTFSADGPTIVDIGAVDGAAWPADRPVAVALLDATPRKSPDRLIRALEGLRRACPDVLIVTAGRERAGSFTESSIAWRGDLHFDAPDDSTLAALYRSSSVVVCASDVEGFGLPPVEAAACGAAVVSPAVPSLLGRPGAAAVCDADAEAITDSAVRLLHDDRARNVLRRSAADAVASLTWEATARTLAEVCRSVHLQRGR